MNTYLIRKVLKNQDSLFKAAYLPNRLAGLDSVQNSRIEVCCLTPALHRSVSLLLAIILFGNLAYDEELLRRFPFTRAKHKALFLRQHSRSLHYARQTQLPSSSLFTHRCGFISCLLELHRSSPTHYSYTFSTTRIGEHVMS